MHKQKILECQPDLPKQGITIQARDLLKSLLVMGPERRIDLKEIESHPFFTKNKIPAQLPPQILTQPPSVDFVKTYVPKLEPVNFQSDNLLETSRKQRNQI